MMWATWMVALAGLVAWTSPANAQDKANPETLPIPTHIEEWLGADNYPPEALRRGEQGRVVVHLTIDQSGRATTCRNDIESGSVALDKATCDILLAKARFEPARDKRGRAVISDYVMPVRWVLPETTYDSRRFSGPSDIIITGHFAADDELLSCDMSDNVRPQSNDPSPCDSLRGGLKSVRSGLKIVGPVAIRMHHLTRHGDAPPRLEAPLAQERVTTAIEARLIISPEGLPDHCSVKVTRDPAFGNSDQAPPSACDKHVEFMPVMGPDGTPVTQHVLELTRYVLLTPAN